MEKSTSMSRSVRMATVVVGVDRAGPACASDLRDAGPKAMLLKSSRHVDLHVPRQRAVVPGFVPSDRSATAGTSAKVTR
jgi:hypothetical protein